MKDIERNISIKKLSEKIESLKNVPNPSLEDVLKHLDVFATEMSVFGENTSYIPLAIKEVILGLLYERPRISCTITKNTEMTFWECEAKVFADKDDAEPISEGRFAYTLTQYAQDQNLSEEQAVISIGNWVRGLAKTRAIQEALPFLNLFCQEEMPKKENPEVETKAGDFPKPEPIETKKENARKKAAEKEKQLTQPETTEKSNEMDLETALSQIADMGALEGHPLREIYERQPRNLIWLLNKGSKQKEALLTIINQDEALKAYIGG